MSGEKTEQPTEHKIRQSREEGQVAKSKDFTQALLVGALFGYFLTNSEDIFRRFSEMILYPSQLYEVEFLDAAHMEVDNFLREAVILLSPFVIIVMVVGVFGEMIQTGILFAFKVLIPKGDRLNPATNVKNIFSTKNFIELAKSIIKVLFLTVVVAFVIRDSLNALILLPSKGLISAGLAISDMVRTLIIYAFIGFGAIALADLIYQRYNYRKQLMMSMDEIKQEYKQLEGDPHMKGHRKQVAKEIAMGEMSLKTRKSSVVVTNPTHLAVALYYKQEVTPLPIVVAKGRDKSAFEMVNIARKYGIPILQNVWLARELTDSVKVDHYISSELIEPVAELLIAVKRISGVSDDRMH